MKLLLKEKCDVPKSKQKLLTEKKGKDRSLLEKWRPISLVNVDSKIMSKVTVMRIKKVLPNIIQHNQSGYVEDRITILYWWNGETNIRRYGFYLIFRQFSTTLNGIFLSPA